MTRSKWVAALSCLWVLAISYRYVNTVVRGFRSPFDYGNDIEWFAIWVATAIVMTLLAATVKRAVEIVFLILIAACVLVFVLSGTIGAAIAVCGILFVAFLTGRRLMLVFGVEPIVVLAVPVGLVLLALGGFALAALDMLTPLSIGLLFLGSTLVSALDIRTSRNGIFAAEFIHWQPVPSGIRFPLLLLAPVIFLNLVWAVAPEIQFDANNYHLAVPQIYLRNHGFIDLPYFFHSYFYRLIEMLFTFAIALRGPEAAKLLSFAFSLIATAGVFSLGRLAFDERIGACAAAFFYTTPIVSWLSGTAYVDNAVAMFFAVTVIAFLRWYRDRGQIGWLYVASILAGATVATKVNAAFGLPILLGVALYHLRNQPKYLAACALLTVSVATPWYALTYLWTDNPVLPMLNGIFKSPLWAFENRVMDANTYGIGASPAALSRLPFSLTWNTVRFGTATPRGAAGSALLFTFPFGLALLTLRRGSTPILFASLLLFFLLWALAFQNVRYYVHILPVVSVLGAATVLSFSKSGWLGGLSRVCLATVLIIQFLPTSMLFSIPDRFPVKAAFGMETREQFLKRSLAIYAGAERLNTMVRPGERVLGVGVEDARFYLKAPLETLADSTLNTVLRAASSLTGKRLLYTLTQSGFDYVFARRNSMKDPPVWLPYIKHEFLDDFATLVFSDENTVVYRLKR
jgi:4-amino-4-deoxy-L-arabinose transferase-like glycosyltransferase